MARSLRSHRRKKNRVRKLIEVYNPVDRERQERVNNRLLVNTYLNNSSCWFSGWFSLSLVLENLKKQINGETAMETESIPLTGSSSSAEKEKKPFSFIERTWEVRNPTEEEVSNPF